MRRIEQSAGNNNGEAAGEEHCSRASRVAVVWCCCVLLFSGLSGGTPASAAEVVPPAPANYVNDYARVLSPSTVASLNRELEEFEQATSSQIVVAIFPRMQTDSSIEDYTVRVGRAWRVGQKTKSNGAILFVFAQDRQMRIEVGYGLEGALPDAIAKRIIEEEIKPHFQRGDYDSGIRAGVAAIEQAVRGEYRGTGRTAAQRKGGGAWPVWILVGVVVLLIALVRFRHRVAPGTIYRRSGRSIYWGGWPGWSSGGGWSGGGWSGGGGGGGGFSGGGGSFGGGGASGSW